MKRGPCSEHQVEGYRVSLQIYLHPDRIKAVALVRAIGSADVVHESMRESARSTPEREMADISASVLADVTGWAMAHPTAAKAPSDP